MIRQEHETEIKQSFGRQAAKFAAYHMSKAEYTEYLIHKVHPSGSGSVLEVAAGTGICGRALAPYVRCVECLDLTEEMLLQGRKLAESADIQNITFTAGNAEALPYQEESFDLVITRLSLHHFLNPEIPFAEMKRVLKTGGRLVVWDMEAGSGKVRKLHDEIETMRDPSHVRILGREEFEKLFSGGFTLETEETTLVPVSLQSWMDLTETPAKTQERIRAFLKDELDGGPETGFDPYMSDGELFFYHHWLLLIGQKL